MNGSSSTTRRLSPPPLVSALGGTAPGPSQARVRLLLRRLVVRHVLSCRPGLHHLRHRHSTARGGADPGNDARRSGLRVARWGGLRWPEGDTVPVLESFLDALGNTPLVRLRSVTRGVKPTILAKLEMLNPGGSVKDRIGLRMIEAAEREGPAGRDDRRADLRQHWPRLAIAAAIRGYRCIFVMPDKMSQEKISLLRAYGAEVASARPPSRPSRRRATTASPTGSPARSPARSSRTSTTTR